MNQIKIHLKLTFILIAERNSFEVENKSSDLKKDISLEKRTKIPDSVGFEWKNDCWCQDPAQRLSFTDICEKLELSEFVNGKINIKHFNTYMKIINRH